MSRPQFDPNMPVLNPEALKKDEEEDPDALYDKWLEVARANPDLSIDSFERECPLFMTDVPTDPSEIEKNPALLAMQNIIHVDQTPQEIAEQFRDRGNEALRMATGVVGWRTARALYTDGLRQEGVSVELRRILFANRAQVELHLGNYGRCINDCVQSIKIQPSVKAYFRCIKASSALEKWETTLEMCRTALKLPEMTEKERSVIEKHQETAQRGQAKQRAQDAEKRRKEKEGSVPLDRLHSAIRQRGLRTGPPEIGGEQMATYTGDRQLAYCEEDGELHFPVLFLYDEYGTSDFVRDVSESTCLRDQLEPMFPPKGDRAPWDLKGHYVLQSLACFFYWDHRQKEGQEGYLEVDIDKPLGDTLGRVYIPVPQLILTFHIVPRGSSFAHEWLHGT
eukprot:GGOE01053784.1.p1 GENE.GGOE01053784.1~~GGOE01053784.1.p1  ORF type:complete len:394 (+),score=95.04 GGOE01053784.1:77-1258(+)